jgi:hypothetical protein
VVFAQTKVSTKYDTFVTCARENRGGKIINLVCFIINTQEAHLRSSLLEPAQRSSRES